MKGEVRIGTSGWNYRGWAGGIFYPPGLKPAGWLRHYAAVFDTVEVNNTFYRLPGRRVFGNWSAQTPARFRFAAKASRFITHQKKLARPGEHVARFLRHAIGLERKLAVVLFQLPPFWSCDPERLEAFCGWWRHQRIWPRLRAALEVRHPSWLGDEPLGILHRHNVALVHSDWKGLIVNGPVTADFVFVRRHGPEHLYASSYSPAALQTDAEQVRGWSAGGRDVYVYFNNDARGFAIANAQALKALVR